MSPHLKEEMQAEWRGTSNTPIPADIFSPLLFSRKYDADTEKDVQFSMKERSTQQSSIDGNFLQSLDASESIYSRILHVSSKKYICGATDLYIDSEKVYMMTSELYWQLVGRIGRW